MQKGMYCAACGKQIPEVRSRCPDCRKFTAAFWLNVYSLAFLGIANYIFLLHLWLVVPRRTITILFSGMPFPVPMRWAQWLADSWWPWVALLFWVSLMLWIALPRWRDPLLVFLRSGRTLGFVTLFVLATVASVIFIEFTSTLSLVLGTVQMEKNYQLVDAAGHGNDFIVKTLLENRFEDPVFDSLSWGVDVDAAGRNGMTALMWAASNGHKSTVEILLTAGASINAKDGMSRTALSLARENSHTDIVEVLKIAGAEE